MASTLGILIAGGAGKRFGSPKALARFRGETLVARGRAVLAQSCDAVVVVAPASMALPVPAGERVADRIEGAGPLAAIVAGLESRAFDRALVLGVDLPRFEVAHARRLLAAWREDAALVPAPGGRAQPLASVFGPAAIAPLAAAIAAGRRALVPEVLALRPRLLDDAALVALDVPPACLEDADTPEALARLEREATAR